MDSPTDAPPPHRHRRKPLQIKDINVSTDDALKSKSKPISMRIQRPMGLSFGKENHCPISPRKEEAELEYDLAPRDPSLAEELASVRKRRERLREEREKTEKELREKDLTMERWAMDLEKRAEEQRNMELELRLLIKLQDLRSSSSVLSPVQSLRDKEQKKNMEVQSQMSSPVQSLREKERLKCVDLQLQGPDDDEETNEASEQSSDGKGVK
ncbi:uncharacterized protein LOC121971685 [Zingiber officinale]|uniref:Uncharacterized protein n=1 Tax=Zingiber officinale TaxID=94328 RepID=A0A8J5LI55_ZINOF|nr:uncharacterized protein LOC121971685 [Zingiber officinale]KAG6516257.1 hypothetical protein ZIOFF_026712 [Zingiber officinale]